MPVLRNTLYVPTIEHNLLPPFILREARIKCNNITNIHVKYPDVDDHALSFAVINICIPLQLWGLFSYFHTRVTTPKRKPFLSFVIFSPFFCPYLLLLNFSYIFLHCSYSYVAIFNDVMKLS